MDASVNRITSSKDERALLVALRVHRQDMDEVTYSLEELNLLVGTAGGIIINTMVINREKIDPAYIIGKGYITKISVSYVFKFYGTSFRFYSDKELFSIG